MHRALKSLVPTLTAILLGACDVPADGELTVWDTEMGTESETASVESAIQSSSRTYRVTVQNVTAGNVISPPLLFAHVPTFRFFTVGSPASAGVAQVAETGGTTTLEAQLANLTQVNAIAKATGGPIAAGQVRTIDITIPSAAFSRNPRLSIIAMIGRSNDSFVSLRQAIDLRQVDLSPVSVALTNFDAGSEENTGNVGDFGSGGHPVAQAEGFVSYDRGLNLRGNAPEITAWGTTAAFVDIKRIR